MAKQKSFDITATVHVTVSISIPAENLASAVETAKNLDVTDFITIDGEYCDGSIQICAVGKSGYWNLPKDDKE